MKEIICGFPGVGKSLLSGLVGWSDSDSSLFSWSSVGIRNPNFPANYIEHLKTLDNVSLVSSHLTVRNALAWEGMPFYLCYPSLKCKDEYRWRFLRRGSPQQFIDLLDCHWDEWIGEMEAEIRCGGRYVLQPGQYASDVLIDQSNSFVPPIDEDRNYTTRCSGHGSGYVKSTPEVFNMTLQEAENDAKAWRINADTIGGDAIIVRRPGIIL